MEKKTMGGFRATAGERAAALVYYLRRREKT